MSIQKTLGFILRREEVRETSLYLRVYTRDFGKINLISKGVRSPEQKFISSYELFALDEIVFYEKKKKDFFLLSQCELVNFFPTIRESLERLSYAVYFIELLDSVTVTGDSNRTLYGLLYNCLGLLSGNASPKRIARIFEIKLLSELGLMPRLKFCAGCENGIKNEKVRFSFSLGGVLCERCFTKDTKAKSVLRGTVNFISHIDSMPFERINQIKVTNKVGSEVESLLKSFIRYHLDIRPKSMEFAEKVGV
ncbi:MAG: DNA repair protein RecO [Candidatus Omnitrophica bacterium]|nr:DNA repair protein RecO [Candidatus Omnitrophota bacterium]